ncbi:MULTISPECIES: SpoIIE family protein phosphatase [Streptomyces]|uniref:SpoIIE family protein phosphatase n=1 Tax=Streptomyces caniscabiei TaxID=2746961 RepID=A0ABU4MJG4_9ACTN|nr:MULTISPECIES: SpoIIE family protein phosphatase [Streptomyces]MBE4735109.1 SpoIIE family protein phosphatase [Streptomyces caniscabiei]MBE4754243.1 SpoIIE family protein phosphatase [Streptomyces caniscabiei]MBE4767835.1 SpoIIE family protein phosphatase [Streptomyces caniscabiei]MBE4784294.1 SpoIIE family protein phosphatase [Streptomyces caniscabiei]MBE4791207.1 SpoIIE family protein phosphatase [Streptomyces caniscabiei]
MEDVGDEGRWWSPAEPVFWRQVVEQLGAALIVTDPAGRVLAANPTAERLLGRSAAAMRGEDAHDLLHRDADGGTIPRERCPLLRAVAARAEARGEGDICLRGDGRLVALSWSASPLTVDGAFMGMAVLFTDTAGDRSARRERAAYTRALEDLTERLTLVAEITDVLGQTLETDEALARLGRLLVPRLADWAAVDLRVGSGQVHRVAATGPAGRDAAQEDWRERLPEAGEEDQSPLVQVLNGGDPVLQREADVAAPAASALAAVHSRFLRAAGAASSVTVPLGSGRQVTGALTLVRTDPAHPFDADDLTVVSDIGRRVGLVIDNARRFGRQRAVAEAMQRNLLAPLPQPGRLRLAARYQPAPAGSQVGGDWYDAFERKDGTLALVIGDVVGHDLTAAAGMAQLHGILRSLAWDQSGPPGAVVDRLDDAMPAITTVPMATLVLGVLEGDPHTGPWTLRWTSAGHPPPLLLTGDGQAQYLEAGQGLLLGAPPGTGGSRPSAAQSLPPGSTLLLYTDGLIEIPGSDLDTGLARLRRHALDLAHEPLDTLCDQLPARMPPGSTDDVALLALRLPSP